jgi:excisionase family DNA binding protein
MMSKNQQSIPDQIHWLSVKDVADKSYSGESSVRRWIKKGLLKAYKLGRDWKVDPVDYQEFMRKSANFSD